VLGANVRQRKVRRFSNQAPPEIPIEVATVLGTRPGGFIY